MNFPIEGQHIYVIKIKLLGALERPNGITIHSYKSFIILKVVFYSSPSFIWIGWYPLRKLIFEKIDAPWSWSNKSLSLGIGKWYLIVILFTAWLSIHIRQVSFFLGAKSAGTAYRLALEVIFFFQKFFHLFL